MLRTLPSWGLLKPPAGQTLVPAGALANGLILALLLREGGGFAVADLTNPVLIGSLDITHCSWPGVGGVNGGPAVAFDGNTAATGINFGSAALFQVQTHSWSCWAYSTDFSGFATSPKELFSRSADITAAGYEWSVGSNGTTATLGFAYFDGAIQGWYAGTQVLTTGRWYHLAATWAPGTVRFYVNGLPDASAATTSGTITHVSDNFLIGSQGSVNQNQTWQGRIDHFLLWNRVLLADEVQGLYERQWSALFGRSSPRPLVGTSGAATIYPDMWAGYQPDVLPVKRGVVSY